MKQNKYSLLLKILALQIVFLSTNCTISRQSVETFTIPQTSSSGIEAEKKNLQKIAPNEGQEFYRWLPQMNTSPSAFPGAEGFGSKTTGGRGGRVIEISNLNDSGPGSLREAINAEEPRTIVFRVAGTIELESPLEIIHPYLTIAGQTAPGGGITIKNNVNNNECAIHVRTHDVIIRYIRSRPGPSTNKTEDDDAIDIFGDDVYNIIVDHSSFSWAVDEVVSTWYGARDITIQWSIISEGLKCSSHKEGCHSMGLLIGSKGSGNISIHHNLFAHNNERNPLIKTSGLVDLVNNVIYNPWGTPVTASDDYSKVSFNVVGNYFKPGVNTMPDRYLVHVSSIANNGFEIYLKENITPNRSSNNLDDSLDINPNNLKWLVQKNFNAPYVTTTSASEAYTQVLADAGATFGLDSIGSKFWRRDPVDERIVNDVINGTGKIINDPSEVGGWPELIVGTPPEDTDHDGMPDRWERLYGLSINNPSDSSGDFNGNGYTNLEEYLNGTNPIH